MNPEKLKVLSAVMDKIEKDFGKGAIMKMSDRAVDKVPVIPSGSVTIDHALGIGGYPKGRIIEIFGPESSGKTTLAIHAIAEAQKAGGIAAFIDAEHAFDSTYAQKLGVDIDDLLISQPDHGEQALEIADLTTLADYFVLATGSSNTQINALVDNVEKVLHEEAGEDPLHREGYRGGTWVLLDYGCIAVHVFNHEAREFYGLERLWRDGKPLDLTGVTDDRE